METKNQLMIFVFIIDNEIVVKPSSRTNITVYKLNVSVKFSDFAFKIVVC
jgi:hypothetical protein